MYAAKDGFHAAFVFCVHFIEQFFQARHVRIGLWVCDEFRRQPAAEADMHAAHALRLQHEIPEVTRREGDEVRRVDGPAAPWSCASAR